MNDFVVIGFKADYENNRETEWVEIAPSGEAFERTRTWHRIKDITPPETVDASRRDSLSHKVLQARWDRISPAYQAWKRGQDIPLDGTPLAAWAGVSPEQAAHMRAMGILTVEGVRDMGEGALARLPFPNAKQMPKLAADFLSSKGEADKDRELMEMRERMAIMEEMLAEQSVKRGPGRPKKQPEEEAA
ncbi:MAG: hypothetical protein ACRC14_02720 [Paracoccaceae bacterium]